MPESCKGNYNSQGCSGRAAVFKFPKTGVLCEQWIRKLNRKDFTQSPQTVVCAANFSSSAVITEDAVAGDDGTILTVKRDHLKLAKDAYPTIFPNQPKYLSQESIPQRKILSERLALLEARDEPFRSWGKKKLVNVFFH